MFELKLKIRKFAPGALNHPPHPAHIGRWQIKRERERSTEISLLPFSMVMCIKMPREPEDLESYYPENEFL